MGDYLFKPRKEIHSEASSNKKIAYAASSMQGYRTSMEDGHNCILDFDKGVSLFAIYDGHLGCEVSVYCSHHLPEFIKKHPQFKTKNYKKCFEESFLEFDEALKEESVINEMKLLKDYNWKKYGPNPIEHPDFPSMEEGRIKCARKRFEEYKPGYDNGCAAVLALVTNDHIYTANIGDCRCIASEAGKALPLSLDHKPYRATERKRICKAGGYVNDGRVDGNFNLSRVFGDHAYKSNKELPNTEQKMIALPDTFTCKLTSKIEFLVLFCDGLVYTDEKESRNQEMIDFVRSRLIEGLDLKIICDQLVEKSLTDPFNPQDNVSCIIVRFLSNKIKAIKTGKTKSSTKLKKTEKNES